MNTFNNENRIIEYFQSDVQNSSVFFPLKSSAAIRVFESVHSNENWSKWTDSSGKAALTPDFYCDDLHLMMELMRVDDHAFKNKKGNMVNPALAHESDMFKELQDSGILERFPNVTNIICSGITNLPTKEDHNYKFYLNNFIRTVSGHKDNVSTYRKNHPDCKLLFFVMDESTAYLQVENEKEANAERVAGKMAKVQLHLFWADNAFVQTIRQSDADYLIWYTPFKLINTDSGVLKLPRACVYDVKKFDIATHCYDETLMVSSEI